MSLKFTLFFLVLALVTTSARTYSLLDSYFTEAEDFCTRRNLICDTLEIVPDHGDLSTWAKLYDTCKQQRATCQFMSNLKYVLALENITNCHRIEEYCYGIADIHKGYPDDMLVQACYMKCQSLTMSECTEPD